MAKKASLFDTIKQHIRNKSAERLNEWKNEPSFNEDIVNAAFDKLDEDLKYLNPHMQIDKSSLKKVLSSGKFKNQFQTHTSGGSLNGLARAKHTNIMFGTPLKEIGKDLWDEPIYDIDKNLKNSEKYGFLKARPYRVDQYGNYRVDFKPSVKETMTAHIDDSLGSDEFSFIPGDRSTYYGMLANPKRNMWYSKDDYIPNLMDGVPLSERGRYLEAQFHGPLTTGDINSIKIDRNEVDPKIREYSTANYIPLYDEQGCYNACYDVAGLPIWIPKD